LAGDNITRLIIAMKYCRYLLSYSPGGSTSHEVGPGTPFCGKRGRRGSTTVPFETAMVVSYMVFIVTIGPQFAIKCFWRWNEQGWVTFGQNLERKDWSIWVKF